MSDDRCDICNRKLCYGGSGVAPDECYVPWRGQHACLSASAARSAALEEAARAVDEESNAAEWPTSSALDSAAARIRALKPTP